MDKGNRRKRKTTEKGTRVNRKQGQGNREKGQRDEGKMWNKCSCGKEKGNREQSEGKKAKGERESGAGE